MNPLIVPAIGGIIETIGKVADDLITSDAERAKADLDAYNAETARLVSQTKINEIEAGSADSFTRRWRPAVGWVGVIALGYASILEPVGRFIAQVMFGYGGAFPVIDTDLTLQVLLGLLGLGAMRSAERIRGVIPGGK